MDHDSLEGGESRIHETTLKPPIRHELSVSVDTHARLIDTTNSKRIAQIRGSSPLLASMVEEVISNLNQAFEQRLKMVDQFWHTFTNPADEGGEDTIVAALNAPLPSSDSKIIAGNTASIPGRVMEGVGSMLTRLKSYAQQGLGTLMKSFYAWVKRRPLWSVIISSAGIMLWSGLLCRLAHISETDPGSTISSLVGRVVDVTRSLVSLMISPLQWVSRQVQEMLKVLFDVVLSMTHLAIEDIAYSTLGVLREQRDRAYDKFQEVKYMYCPMDMERTIAKQNNVLRGISKLSKTGGSRTYSDMANRKRVEHLSEA